ncbi:tRNA (adenine57-N1/adenine58-N1)-methyltransferase [Hydrogenivirga caldilitoris]|uniref:tRNA (adenine(58)-N(1))-methyltransferase TrmI n=1 Tax=Hydrogenivirga caldilitoris TaxID=246264 RepID=A0A497XNW7_9AQUI|nr:tRNA (adenine-N1)-methyltransferase [Hydrogenivirga caldilitoris]RLJ70666.1 tRNA (adenine57-N1/adenine58-N1)-methyltransferase [Hydrogenivirga caldilitoris]
MFQEGDWILVRYLDKKYLKRLELKQSLNVKKNTLKFSEVIGKPDGIKIGKFEVFKPTLEEIIVLGFERKTQIIYPKDAFYIAFKLGLSKEKRVLEFGTGSGALCAVLSQLAGEVYTYEAVERFYNTARKNLERFNLGKNVKFHNLDFSEVEVEKGFFDAAFVDVREPTPYLRKLHTSLKEGAPVGFLLPTSNQVVELLKNTEGLFGNVEVLEILTRYYKTVPERFRPEDTMVGHTAYLLFCRKVIS